MGGKNKMKGKILTELVEVLAQEKKLNLDDVREEAFRLYFNLRPEFKLEGTIICYLKGVVSLSRAAELVGITVPEFKEILASRGILRETEDKKISEIDEKITQILN